MSKSRKNSQKVQPKSSNRVLSRPTFLSRIAALSVPVKIISVILICALTGLAIWGIVALYRSGDDKSNLQINEGAAAALSVKFTSFDTNVSYDDKTDTVIDFCENTAQITGEGASFSDSELTISKKGTYVLHGKLTDGRIIVSVPSTEKVRLVFDTLSVTCSYASPVMITDADKVLLCLADGTENIIRDTRTSDSDENLGKAAIYSKADLTVNGTGTLTVTAEYRHGIATTKDLRIVSGNITVNSTADALKGNDSVAIGTPKLSLCAGDDGIRCENEEETDKGYIYIMGGDITLTAAGHGINASLYAVVCGGNINITTTGTERKTVTSTWGTSYDTNSERYYKIKSKGIKAGCDILLSGGKTVIVSTGHSVDSGGSCEIISDAELTASAYCGTYRANSKGICAQGTLSITGGNVTVQNSYEGLESKDSIIVTGGLISVLSSDDGYNSLGDLYISGGEHYVNASGDGIDSNASIYISGGTVIVAGPTSSANGAIDCGDGSGYKVTVNGGVLVAYGASGMAVYPDSSTSTQTCIGGNVNISSGNVISIVDDDGKELCTFTATKSASSLCVSLPSMKKGTSYQVITGRTVTGGDATLGYYTGDYSVTGGSTAATLKAGAAVSSGGMGGGMGGGGKGGGGFPPR